MSKNGKPSIINGIKAKKGERERAEILENYFCFSVSTKRPLTIEGLKNFMEDAIKEISNNNEIITVTQYLHKHGIPRRTYYGWLKKFEFMKEYHDIILSIIADRNVEVIKRDYRYIHFIQPYFDEYVYGKMANYWAKLKDEQQTANADVIKAVLQEVLKPFDSEVKKKDKE